MDNLPTLTMWDAGAPLDQNQQERRRPHKGYDDCGKELNQCQICQRTYDRADHLSRHMRSHENTRPFRCHICQKSFNRGDLLNRHVLGHQRALNTHTAPAPKRLGDRVGKACVSCAASKARCDDEKPCRRCRHRRIPCAQVSQSIANGQEMRHDLERVNQGQTNQAQPLKYASQYGVSEFNSSSRSDSHLPVSLVQYFGDTSNVPIDVPQDHPSILQHQSTVAFNTILVPVSSVPPDFDAMMDDLPHFAFPPEFNNQVWDGDIYDFDFSIDNFELTATTPQNVTLDKKSQQKIHISTSSVRDASRGHAAFTRSPWLWTPTKNDKLFTDHDSLALEEREITSPVGFSSEYSSTQPLRNINPSIRSTERDKMLYLISAMRGYTSGTSSFPSLEILNYLVEAFFVRQSNEIDLWVHTSAISQARSCPEFLVAIVSAGSTVISAPAIWKMGLAMQDMVRITVGNLWDRDNKKTRELQPLQAWLMSLDTGLWSGYQRPMELAEGLLQPITTMMRRGGLFDYSPSTQGLFPAAADEGSTLETKWRKWVEMESFKRLSIHIFLHDARASIALQKNHLISARELTLPVPAARALFLAKSASEWKLRYLAGRQQQSTQAFPILIDACRDPSILNDIQDEVDIDACHAAILYGYWHKIWAFRDSSAFHAIRDNKTPVQALWLPMQQRELSLQLEEFKDRILQSQSHRPELILTAELFLMILYISPDELQTFAGKGGEEAVSRVLPALEGWSCSEQGRRAVWHAAQVFRNAAQLSPTTLRDFYAIAVYFAGLTMWAYGHLSPMPGTPNQSLEIAQRPPLIILNGEETRESRAFITRGTGSAVLMLQPAPGSSESSAPSNSPSVALSDPNGILSMARDLYRDNFPVTEEPLPALVHNMGNLMRDLSCLPESRFSRCPSLERSSVST